VRKHIKKAKEEAKQKGQYSRPWRAQTNAACACPYTAVVRGQAVAESEEAQKSLSAAAAGGRGGGAYVHKALLVYAATVVAAAFSPPRPRLRGWAMVLGSRG
jgi:hypothetical protein